MYYIFIFMTLFTNSFYFAVFFSLAVMARFVLLVVGTKSNIIDKLYV